MPGEINLDISKDVHNYEMHYCNQQAGQIFEANITNQPSNLKDSQYLILQKRCLHEIPDNMMETAMTYKEQTITNENMNTLEETNLGPSILTLQEAISTLDMNSKGSLFLLKLSASSTEEKSHERVIRLRSSEVFIDDEKRIILLISDLTDSFNYQKMCLKQKEEQISQRIIGQELNMAFSQHV